MPMAFGMENVLVCFTCLRDIEYEANGNGLSDEMVFDQVTGFEIPS